MSLGTVEDRLLTIDRELDGLKQEGLERKPSAKSGRQTFGAIPDEEFAGAATSLVLERRAPTNKAPAAMKV
jgi:hypothetical protein